MWEIEEIPDADLVLYRIHQTNFVDGEIVPGAFRETGNEITKGMSTNWSKYSTPKATRKGGPQNFNMYAVISFVSGVLRSECELEVIHSPSKNNRAHSLVKGIDVEKPKKEEIRLKLLDLFKWEIKFK